MKRLALTLLLTGLLIPAGTAQAEPKPWIFGWWDRHWQGLDFEPYLEPAKEPHNTQWDKSVWQPNDWIAQRESETALIRDFYFADILRDQYIEDDMPVLVVGPGFYMLGGEDKRRVTETVDHVYGITGSRLFGMYMIRDWRTEKAVGAYTQYGLQIQ